MFISPERAIDIDTPLDFKFAECLIKVEDHTISARSTGSGNKFNEKNNKKLNGSIVV